MSARLEFWDLVRLEPRLRDLLVEALQVDGSSDNFCANRVWYGPNGLKSRLVKLVGFSAESRQRALGTTGAYDTAYEIIYGALPYCKHPGGIC